MKNEIKQNVDFEQVLLTLSESITETAQNKKDNDSFITVAYTTENKAIFEDSQKIQKYTVDKSKNTIKATIEPTTKYTFLGKIYNKSSDEIEEIVNKHRKNLAVSIALNRLMKVHIQDHKTMLAFLSK